MNFQDASNLRIPEGYVRTIHDKNNRLLWGSVGYNVSFDGNATQTTYSGKNKMPMADADMTGEAGRNRTFRMALPAGTYTVSFDLDSFELGTNTAFGVYMQIYASSVTALIDLAIINITSTTGTGRKTVTFTINEDATTDRNDNIRIASTNWNNGARAKISNIQIESGSTATDYEPYVGGIPAPNPAYPQDINVVTGTQTIDINGTSYPINLGNIWLAKIGTYQDRIYKDGEKWYVEKQTGKVVLDGSETWTWSRTSLTTGVRYHVIKNDIGLRATNSYGSDIMSDHFKGVNYTTYYQAGGVYGVSHSYYQSNHYIQLFFAESLGDTTALQTWLASNPTTVYYALATPTTTEITDATLIAQLEAVYDWVRRHGYNAQVSGDLPIVINRTALPTA